MTFVADDPKLHQFCLINVKTFSWESILDKCLLKISTCGQFLAKQFLIKGTVFFVKKRPDEGWVLEKFKPHKH